MNLPKGLSRAWRKIAVPRSRLIFFSRQKEGHALPNRRVDLGAHRHTAPPLIYTHARTYIRVISPTFRNIRRRGKVVEGETYLVGLANSPFVSPAASRASDVFPAHDRKYFLFVRVHGTSSIRLPLKSRCAGSAFHRTLFVLKGFERFMRIEGQ